MNSRWTQGRYSWIIRSGFWYASVFPGHKSESGMTRARASVSVNKGPANRLPLMISVWEGYFNEDADALKECQRRLEMLEKAVI